MVLFLLLAALPLRAEESVDLRGYGNVTADLTANRAVFECESVEKADILLDKLVADLFWDETNPPHQQDAKVGSSTVKVYSLPGQGAAVLARAGTSVVVLGAADENQAIALAAKEPLLLGSDVTSQPRTKRPIYLDYFDNTSFETYVSPMASPLKLGLDTHWPFIKSIKGGEAISPGLPAFHFQNPAPNVIDWTTIDYEVLEATREGGLISVDPWIGAAPLWAYNAYPDQMRRVSDTTLLGEWGGVGEAGGHYLSWSMPSDISQELGLGFLRQVMERYVSCPAIGGWHLEAGAPGPEYAFHDRPSRSWDTSAAGQAGWRSWLQEEQHYSLTDLGTRWYGDPNHFTDWNQVMVPDSNEFFGQLGPDSFRLQTGWQTQNVDALTTSPDDDKWLPVEMPPSQQEAFLSQTGANYFQTSFDPGDWLKEQQAKGSKDVWLVVGATGTGVNAVQIWWNNAPVEVPKDIDSKEGPFAVRVTDLIQPGSNQLRIGLASAPQTSKAKLAGPVFLTVHEPKRLPYLGREANARYVDLIDWQNWAMADSIRRVYELARKIDPNRSFILSTNGYPTDTTDYACQIAADYGAGLENTGSEAGYAPWWSGLGLVGGFYSTSEESNTPQKSTPQGDMLERGFSWVLFEANSNHSLDQNIEDFIRRESEDGWFTRHRRQIELFGKYLREQPKIVLLRSTESIQLHSREPYQWDIGRGEIEASHYDCAYATENQLKAGLVDKYPVLMDTGSEFMEPDTVAAIRKYVEQGGTFIALHNTARHTALDPDCYPLAEVSGFKVTDKNKSGTIQFEATLPIFKGWEGKDFNGSGSAIDWLNYDAAAQGSAILTSTDPAAIPLAKWDDGSIAIGYRQLGKGQIITLGSTFWRQGKDVSGAWRTTAELESQFLERLFTDCGVTRVTNASVPEVWTRKMDTKNGLQNWLMAFNSTNATVNADIWMACDSQPDQVFDLQTGAPVTFDYENQGVSIKGVAFNPYEVKVFGVKRPSMVSGLDVWWHEKTTYWKRTPAQIAAEAMTLPAVAQQKGSEETLPLNTWSFKTDPDKAISAQPAWTAADFDDSSWKSVGPGPWGVLDPTLKDYHGTGLYRVKFTVPPAWSGRRILLSLYSWNTPIVYDKGDFFVNGTQVASYAARGWSQTYNYDITAQVHPGENVLALQVTGGMQFGGIGGAIWIEAWAPLTEPMDLSGQWQAVKGDQVTRVDATVPGSTTGKYLTREIQIPIDWKGKSVFLEWSSMSQWVSAVVVNGKPICYNPSTHPFGLWSRVNITPYLKAGETNTIELWPFTILDNINKNDPKHAETDMQINEIRIGVHELQSREASQ